MTSNPFAEDPTTHATYFEGRWHQTGRTLTTGDVSGIHAKLAQTVERINGRRGLSDQAKRIQIARAYKEARDTITGMKQGELDRINGERAKLGRKLFGHEGDADAQTVIIRRDAQDRAAKLTTPEDAQRALRSAETNGDVHLAQAIAAHANAHSWADVVGSYLTARPEAGDTAQRLQALPDTSDPVWRMQHAMTYSVMKPQELGDISDWQVDSLAASELDVA